MTAVLLAKSRAWQAAKEDSAAVLPRAGGPLMAYVRTGDFEITVPAPDSDDAERHCDAYGGACHSFMQADDARMGAFTTHITRAASGQTVMDVGTGPDAVLALCAARAGATRVYAVEGDHSAATRAAELVAKLEREGAIGIGVVIVVPKISTALTAADVPLGSVTMLLHELLGFIASSEGVLGFVRALAPFLAPCCISVPDVAATMVAPGAPPPLELLLDPKVEKDRRRIGPRELYLLCTGASLPTALLRAVCMYACMHIFLHACMHACIHACA